VGRRRVIGRANFPPALVHSILFIIPSIKDDQSSPLSVYLSLPSLEGLLQRKSKRSSVNVVLVLDSLWGCWCMYIGYL
jgi:hypothetical protein